FESGELIITAGSSVLITNATGLVLRGKCSIYNFGTFQCLGNIVMDYGLTSALNPNIIINATPASVFKMPNQYFVINNPWSKFVNMGTAEFHGIITDPAASAGSVCLGDTSTTIMRVLYNNAKNPYIVPSGNACLSVQLYSQFKDTLTKNSNLYVCLGTSHYSDSSCIPWGCKPNAWGPARLVKNCSTCELFKWVLPLKLMNAVVRKESNYNLVQWRTNRNALLHEQRIEKSTNGIDFLPLPQSIVETKDGFQLVDRELQEGTTWYKISILAENKTASDVKLLTVRRENIAALVYPNPCTDHLSIRLPNSLNNPQVTVVNDQGQNVLHLVYKKYNNLIRLQTSMLMPGNYYLMITDRELNARLPFIKQ
ncbi:MAG: T9SS type A sorting domain-containing protein, partial [Chitinophagaceae bacterium]